MTVPLIVSAYQAAEPPDEMVRHRSRDGVRRAVLVLRKVAAVGQSGNRAVPSGIRPEVCRSARKLLANSRQQVLATMHRLRVTRHGERSGDGNLHHADRRRLSKWWRHGPAGLRPRPRRTRMDADADVVLRRAAFHLIVRDEAWSPSVGQAVLVVQDERRKVEAAVNALTRHRPRQGEARRAAGVPRATAARSQTANPDGLMARPPARRRCRHDEGDAARSCGDRSDERQGMARWMGVRSQAPNGSDRKGRAHD